MVPSPALMLTCPVVPARLSPTPPASFLLPLQHSSLCVEPGQAAFPQLCSEFSSGAPGILSFQQVWVRTPYSAPMGIPTSTLRAALGNLWSRSTQKVLDFFPAHQPTSSLQQAQPMRGTVRGPSLSAYKGLLQFLPAEQ